MDFLESLYKFFTNNPNPIVTSMVSLYGLGLVTWAFRKVPASIGSWIWTQSTTTVVINNHEEAYYQMLRWIGQRKMHRCMRKFVFGSDTFWGGGRELLSLGYGVNWIVFRGRPIRINRITQESNGIFRTKETMTMTVVGRNQNIFKDILQEIKRMEAEDTEHITVFRFKDGWTPKATILKRSLNTITLPQGCKEYVCGHIQTFFEERDWYRKNGIPHRTGLLFYGPPGTGKTSLVTALCSHFDKNCYILNLRAMNDESLSNALATVPSDGFVLIEDIDASFMDVHNRVESIDKDKEKSESAALGVSLAGLLNAIDGVCSADNRVLFATTNYLDRLDAALIREGRFNTKVEMGFMDNYMLRQYFTRLYPMMDATILEKWSVRDNIAPCKVQQLVFENRDDPQAVLSQIAYRVAAA